MGYAIKQIRPTRVVIVFDGKGGSQRRRETFTEYKGNRKPGSDIKRSYTLQVDEDPSASMRRQMQRLLQYLCVLPLNIIIIDHIEADDTIAYLTKLVKEENGQSFIMSTDRDFLQLVDKDVAVWSPTKKKLYFENDILDEYGIHPNNFLLYRTITGDKGDNLPKIKGIGIGTLLKKIPEFKDANEMSIDNIMSICESNIKDKALSSIKQGEALIRLNYELMQLKDVNISAANKFKIMEGFKYPITPFVKETFFKMLIEDRMVDAIRNIEGWTRDVFMPLNMHARNYK